VGAAGAEAGASALLQAIKRPIEIVISIANEICGFIQPRYRSESRGVAPVLTSFLMPILEKSAASSKRVPGLLIAGCRKPAFRPAPANVLEPANTWPRRNCFQQKDQRPSPILYVKVQPEPSAFFGMKFKNQRLPYVERVGGKATGERRVKDAW
jgi:hypothetical protein